MARKYRIKTVPHKNKDGSVSKTKKDYVVIEKNRGKKREVGVASSGKAAEEMIDEDRRRAFHRHLYSHPNDKMFRAKHKIGETA